MFTDENTDDPLIYFTGKAGARGLINLKLEKEGREFIIIPV